MTRTPATRAVPRSRAHAPVEHSLRPRLTAVGPSAADVVRRAGGWLFDQAMAGWDVTVITTDHADPRPLRILGARGRDVEILHALRTAGACLQSVAVRGDLYESDPLVREMVLMAARAGRAEIRLWGEDWAPDTADVAGQPRLVAHQLSLAAQAFKARALGAYGMGGPGGDVELFRRGDLPLK